MNPAISEHEAAGLAAEMFDHFCAATTMRQILGLYRNMCDILQLRPGPLNEFYPKFKAKIRNWKAQALWKKFDARASHRVYNKGAAASGTRVLVIGAGPCGLRTAIEAQLLGAKVVVVEKRDRISRNNVLHLWPFLITDLKALGAKKFYGKFCAGSIDHISIRQLQCILLKVALILGVEVHEGVSFTRELEPKDGCGWRAAVSPEDHAVSHYEFDVLIGADGKRNTLEGFKRKEFRGKLAIAITANFINKKTEAEAKVEEISGVAFIFNQSFFKELYQTTGIDLENIVYYKDETHYFVMTAKKHSLLDKGVIIQDYADPAELLSSANVDTSKLLDYAKEAANFSTKYQMPNLEFAVNHYGKPDVAMFDFTSMFAADNSCKITVRKNYRLLSCLVGDSLLEPFWPTGSGCARGFLSSMDAAYAIKLFSNPKNSLLAVLAQRESIYRLLAQTTPENLHRDIGSYTVDPSTRYPNLNKSSVNMIQVKHLLDTDDPALLEQTFLDSNALTAGPEITVPKRKRRTNDTVPLGIVLLRWVKSQLKENQFVQELSDASQCFTNGRVLCTLINRYRPDLVNLEELQGCSADECNEFAFAILEDHLGIPRVMSGQDSLTLTSVDSKHWLNYLEQICEVFRGEIPHVKHPKLDYAEFKQKQQIDNMEEFAKLRRFAANRMNPPTGATPAIMAAASATGIRKTSIYNEEERAKRSRKVLGAESSPIASPQTDTTKRAKKRRSYEKFGNIEERTRRLQEIESNRADRQTKRRLARAQQTQNFFTSLHMLQANTLLRESDDSSGAFEDYSLFLYRQSAPVFNDRVKELEMKLRYPDRDRGLAAAYPRGLVGADGEQFSDRIRSMEQRIGGGRHAPATEKKPKDLLRAIGKIDSNDWNVKEIEKKIELSKKATDIGKSRERVPKWNREQFLARQNKLTQLPDGDEKYKEFDSSIKAIDKQLKEGHNLDLGERGRNKVASIAGQLQSTKQQQQQQQQQNQKTTSKAALVLTASGVAEKCHFCKQRVYLMEKISAENLTLHRSCLKCHHCHTNLRLGGYAFDRDDPEGKFYCTQHFKLPSKTVKPVPKRSLQRTPQQVATQSPAGTAAAATVATTQQPQPSTPDSKSSGINFDLLDRGETPERIEFENADEAISDGEAAMEVIDENEWTDRNFGTESEESDEDISSSDESESDSDSDYEEAAGSPLGAQTLQLASEWISDKRFSNMVDSDDDFYGYSSEDDEADSQTEGEELARAREMRMQEVKLMPPLTLPTDTETEVPLKPLVEPTIAQSNLNESPCTSSSTLGNNPVPPAPPVESAEEKAIREKMLQKLSVREQWLHSSTPSPPPQGPPTSGTATASAAASTPPPIEPPKPKTSFFGGLMNSLSTLIKSDKQQSPPKPLQSPPKDSPPVVVPEVIPVPPSPSPSLRRVASQSSPKPPPSPTPSLRRQNPSPTPSLKQKHAEVPGSPTPSLKKHRKHKPATPSPTPSTGSFVSTSGHPDDEAFDALFKEELKESNSSGRSTPHLKRRSRPKVREEADDFLEKIKQDQAALDRRMKKVEAQKFKNNMQSIKSAVEGPRIVGVKSEKDVSKFFTGAKVEAKPKQLPNKDVSALQGINLAKYFPNANPAPATSPKASAGTPSSVSSVEGSPMLTRKKSSDVDLMKYFGPCTAKSSPSTPSSLASPAISRKNSVESPTTVQKVALPKPTVNLAPKPPVVPLPPKKNILAFQPIKKSSTESTITSPAPPSPGLTKNALAFQPIAGKTTPPSPKAAPKASNSPPKKTPATRKSPTDDDKLFDDLLKDIDKSPLATKKLTKTPPQTKKKIPDGQPSPQAERKPTNRASPKLVKKSKPPTPKRGSPDLDEQLFEDLLGDVDDAAVENFEEIVGLPKPRQSPKLEKKKLSPKQSPKPVKKPTAPAVPKMTVKRPPFKITVPVKMQETLEEIYLASLSKLDTRSASSTSLNLLEPPINSKSSSDHDLGKVDEAFEALLQETPAVTTAEPIKIQPFQAPQRKRTSPPKQAAGAKGAEVTSETKQTTMPSERTLVSQVVPIAPATPKVMKKTTETSQTKLSRKDSFKSTESVKQAAATESPKKITVKAKEVGSTTSLDKVAAVPKKIDTGSKPATPVMTRKVTSSPVAKSETTTPILTRKNAISEQLPTSGTPVLARKANNSSLPTAVINGDVMPKISTKVVNELATPAASRKIVNVNVESTSKPSTPVASRKILPTPTELATPVASRKIVNVNVESTSKPSTPVASRKILPTPTEPATPVASLVKPSTPVASKKFVPTTEPATPVAIRMDTVTKPSTPVVSQKVVLNEPLTPVASRKTNIATIETVTKPSTPVAPNKIVQSNPEPATIVLAKNSISSVSITATPVAAKTIEMPEPVKMQSTVDVKPVSASSTLVLTKSDVVKEPLKSVIEVPKLSEEESKLEDKPKQRKLSSDEICFEELRKKHEAVFRGEPEQEAPIQELVESKPVDVPRTLSEFRSSILCKPAPRSEQDGPASPVSDKINELVAEIMPGANLDDMIDEVPVPVERKKSSFAKMFNKLQRANTIAAMEASALKPLAPTTKQNDEEYKIEVIRETPAKKEAPQPDRMKINLERSAQIKEQYAKQKAPSPPKVNSSAEVGRTGSFKIQSTLPKVESVQKQESAPVPMERRSPTKKQLPSTQKPLERTESLKSNASQNLESTPTQVERRSPTKKMPSVSQKPLERTESLKTNVEPAKKQESAPIPMERRSPTKKQLPVTPKPLERTTSLKVNAESAQKLESAPKPVERKSPKKQLAVTKPLERTTSLRVTAEPPKVVDRKPFQLPTPKDIDQQLSILSREPGNSTKPFVVDFDDLLDSVETTEVVSFDDLLSSDDEKPIAPPKTIPKKVEAVPVVTKAVTVQKQVPTAQMVPEQKKPVQTENTVKKVEASVIPKAPTQNKLVEVPVKTMEKKLETAEQHKSVAIQSTSKAEPLTEKEFKQAAQQLTDKFLSAQLAKPQEVPAEKKDLQTEAMMTVLTEATDISVKETDLFDSLCTPELTGGALKQDSLISKSTTSISTLPDVVSMTQKPAIEESKPLKVLDYTDKIKQITNHVPQEIQVYTLHTEEDKPDPQPSTSGVTNNYAHILKDITSGIVGSDLAMSVTYEPPPVIDRKPKSDFTTYKQMLQEKSHESPEPMHSQQPQRPLRKPKQVERSVSPIVARPFDNSICVDPRRIRKSPSIENVAIEQVFVKQDDKVIDTFYVVPEQPRQLKRRSKSYDRLEVPNHSKASARQAKKSLDELRDYGFDIEPPSTVKHLVNPKLRHFDFEGSDEELSSFREPKRFDRVRKCNSTSDTSKLDVEATRVDIDRESPIPRSTDFSKWEAILDRGVPYYKEQKHQKKEDVKTLERKLEDLKVERKPRKRFPAKTTIPKDYDPQEYVPRINRRFEEPDSDLPKWYDPDEYVPKAQRGNPMYETDVPISRSNRAYDMEVPVSRPQRISAHEMEVPMSRPQRISAHEMEVPMSRSQRISAHEMEVPVSRPQRVSAHEMDVPISRVGGRYYHEPMHLDDFPVSHTLPRSKTATHIPYSSVSSRSHDHPSREIAKTQYSRRAMADNSAIVSRSQRLHEKANKYIRSQISKNDPNPYIRELAESDDDDFHLPTPSSTAHRTPITTSSSSYHHPTSSYGSSGSAAMSRITAKAITQPSRMTHYNRKDVPSPSGSSSYRRGGESSNRRDNCAISGGSDSDSNSEEVNSATEISTDSEFDHEPSHHRLPPRIFIDDTHLRRPAKVQVKQMTIDNGVRQRRQFSATTNVRNPADNKQRTPGDDDPYYKRDIHLEFKPLIEVDPTIKLSQNRAPLSIPRPGDYTLSKTASTEGIASKKSLELKKKYLLGESTAGTGVLKSGSASALDSKFKSFHSNITECQKLLNPAPEISPTMQTFLQKTAAPPPAPATSLLSLRKEAMLTGRNEEKENVYDGKIAPKRYAETVNATLVENKLNELKKEEAKDKKDDRPNNNNERLIETISLITPEKETRKVEEEQTEQKPVVEEDGDRIVEIKNISNLKHMFIDLTSDSPNCDRSLVETTLNFSMTPPSAAKGTTVQSNGELKNNIPDIISSIKIDSNENKVEEAEEQERTRSPAHETSIQVPEVPWDKEREDEEDIDSDSISESSSSSSSTSSVDDIPHFILDSTTSPETQNDERFVPRVEVRDTAGELMQIDSLMIIDGKYIGDPEDLKLLEELPPDTKIAAKISQQEMNLDSICVLQSRDEKVLEEEKLPTPTEEQKPPPIPLPVLELEPKEEPVEQPASKPSSPTQPKPDLKFDTRNENKLDTLKNLPLVLDLQPSNQSQPQKPRNLTFAANRKSPETDAEKTPLAPSQLLPQLAKAEGSDSETEFTAQNLTETELSDWAADDAVSENFVDIEFALSSNKGTIKRNKPKHGRLQQKKVIAATPQVPTAPVEVRQQSASEDGIIKNLAIEDIEFMDTGSEEESCIESYSTTNRTMLKNRGYVEFVDTKNAKPAVYAIGNSYGQQQQLQQSSKPKLVEAINKQVAGVDYIEQGAYLLNSTTADDSKTPMNEEPPTKITFSALAAQNKALQQPQLQQLDSLNDIEEDSLLIVTSSQGTGGTTTEESEAPTIVAPVERTGGSGSSGRGSVSSFSSKQLEGDKSVGGSPVRKVSTESSSGGKRSSLERNLRKDSLKSNIDDIGYDEYVKRLQQKIALISSARDSLEVKKSKRKSSKGDAGLDEVSVAEPVKKPATASIYTEQSSLEVPKSVEKKIEEITKERVKQKDIIHDLVMDKLQTKKQLNAEKRLNRSRNRNNVLPGVSPGTPSQPLLAHPPEGFPSYQPVSTDRRNRILDSKETTFAQPTPVPIFPNKENIASFATPASYLQATPRTTAKKPAEETLTLTEQLREEARARARLKSNQDLGLSPEDRVQLLRKKFHINLRELNDQQDQHPNKCDDTKFKERTTKLMTSKSVNDVSILKNLSNDPDFISPVDDGSPAAALIGAKLQDYVSDPNLVQSPTTGSSGAASDEIRLRTRSKCKDRERRKSIIEKVSEFFNSRKKTEAGSSGTGGGSSGSKDSSPTKKEGCGSGNELAVPNSGSSSTSGGGGGGVGFLRFKISPKLKDKSKSCFDVRNMGFGTKEGSPYERCASEDCLKNAANSSTTTTAAGTTTTTSGRDTTTTSSPPGGSSTSGNRFTPIGRKEAEELEPPPIPPLPLNYQRSDDESCATNEPKNELKKLRAMSKASRQAELKRLRIAQEIQREQEEIEVKIKDLETRGVEIEKELRGESESLEKNIENLGANDEGLVKEWLELMRSITRLKVRDEELTIRQQELQLEHRHAQLKEELNMRLSCSKLDKNSSDVAAEGAILNEMLEIVAKRQALRPSLDAAAAAAAASVGGAPMAATTTTTLTMTPRSKDVSDI